MAVISSPSPVQCIRLALALCMQAPFHGRRVGRPLALVWGQNQLQRGYLLFPLFLHVHTSPLFLLFLSFRHLLYFKIVVVRDPVARAVAVYYWLGRRPAALRRLVGMKDPVVNPMEPPPIVKAMHYAKNLPEAYTGTGGGDLPK
jgi:hypothetical protein